MAKHRTRVGIHARNATQFRDADFELIRRARIETLKTMSQTEVGVYKRLRGQDPNLEFIVRLFDDRLRNRNRPKPAEFVARMLPVINQLKPYAVKFEIHNEPNLVDGLEGWGASDADAKSFREWYLSVLQALKKACPWAQFGFPGLAVGGTHRDLAWLEICRDAIDASDFLGCHCYWQQDNMLSEDWGLRFIQYHLRFPEKPIEITEFGNSTPGLARDQQARQYAQYYAELHKYYYLGSASAFLASSPDPTWSTFVWAKETGELLPVVDSVAKVSRSPVDPIQERYFAKTGRFVRNSFLAFYERYGQSICGYPITEQFTEKGVAVQYFQRLAMEEYEPGKIRLKLVGSEAWASRTKIAALEARVKELDGQPIPVFKSAVDGLSKTVTGLEKQIDELQKEVTRLSADKAAAGEPLATLVSTMQGQVEGIQAARDDLKPKLDAASKAVGSAQSQTIADLEAEVKSLKERAARLEEDLRSLPSGPSSGPMAKPAMSYAVPTLPKNPNKQYEQRALSEIDAIVIHHSATPADAKIERVAEYHIKQWDWAGIGYHFWVAADGSLTQTNDLETVSNHVGGHNTRSVGVCVAGSFVGQSPPMEQVQGVAKLLAWLLQELRLRPEAIVGHRELNQTACPGDQFLTGGSWKGTLLEEVARAQEEAKKTAVVTARPIYHYMLFWAADGKWAQPQWEAARTYMGTFLPTAGFRATDAAQAEYVTIVGPTTGVSKQVEDWLKAAGCTVERVAGADDAGTKRLLDDLAAKGTRFASLTE